MRRTLLIVAAACALAAAHPVLAGTFYPPNSSSLAPQSTEPMILGEVTDITSQAVMVRTPDGQIVPVHYDSRTVMSHQLETGTAVKVAYELQSDNVYRAQRVTPIEHGSSDWNELVAMKANGADEGELYAGNDLDSFDESGNDTGDIAYDENSDRGDVNDQYSGHANDESDMSGRPYDQDTNPDANTNGDDADDDANRQLPTTASSLTLVLMTGWLLLTAAGCMWLVRRRGV